MSTQGLEHRESFSDERGNRVDIYLHTEAQRLVRFVNGVREGVEEEVLKVEELIGGSISDEEVQPETADETPAEVPAETVPEETAPAVEPEVAPEPEAAPEVVPEVVPEETPPAAAKATTAKK